ncbi:MAG TPA: tetratricopeptide repeat protein [Oculatellaceae cyanobacterium]
MVILWLMMTTSCSGSPTISAQELYDRGCELGTHGYYQSAIKLFSQAIAKDKRYCDAYYGRAVAFMNTGAAYRALNDLNTVLSIAPDFIDARQLRAEELTRLGLWHKALLDYNVIIAGRRRTASDYAERAALLAHIGNGRSAQADWRAATKLDSKYAHGHLGRYEHFNASFVSEFERDCTFVGVDDKVHASFAELKIDNWSQYDKMVIAELYCKVKQHFPGLVQRATNGQKLFFCFSHTSTDRSGMDTASSTRCLTVYSGCFSEPPEKLEWMLVHELVHMVDVDDYISCSRSFGLAATPVIMRVRAHNREFDWNEAYSWSAGQQLDPRAVPYGLPTLYAATEPSEALAECTVASVFCHWHPPQEIEKLIRARVLEKPSTVDEKVALLCQAADKRYSENVKAAIPIYVKVLQMDETCTPALIGLASCWNAVGEQEIALYYTQKALTALLASNQPPNYQALADTYDFIAKLKRYLNR